MVTVKVPLCLENDWIVNDYRAIDISALYVALNPIAGGRKKYMPVDITPHYFFVRHFMFREDLRPSFGYENYRRYTETNKHACSEEEFIKLIQSILTNGYDWEKQPIFVFRHWSRIWPFGRWDVADGFHRLAVLAASGERFVKVATLRRRNTILGRISRSFRGHDGR